MLCSASERQFAVTTTRGPVMEAAVLTPAQPTYQFFRKRPELPEAMRGKFQTSAERKPKRMPATPMAQRTALDGSGMTHGLVEWEQVSARYVKEPSNVSPADAYAHGDRYQGGAHCRRALRPRIEMHAPLEGSPMDKRVTGRYVIGCIRTTPRR